MREVLMTEFLKLRRSAVTWITAGVVVVAVLGASLLTWIVREPDRAASLGLLGTKANLSGLEATWPAFGLYLSVIAGAGGMLLLAFIVTHLFGSEYAEDTAKNLLGLPLPRWTFVAAKLVVAAVWWLVLVLVLLGAGFAAGVGLQLPGLTPDSAASTVATTFGVAGAGFLLAPTAAWVTIASRSYLAPIGFALGMLLLGNLLGHTGWGDWFPWSIVPRLTGMSGGDALLPWTAFLVLGLTFAVTTLGAAVQLSRADSP